jgi:hypothetical protein
MLAGASEFGGFYMYVEGRREEGGGGGRKGGGRREREERRRGGRRREGEGEGRTEGEIDAAHGEQSLCLPVVRSLVNSTRRRKGGGKREVGRGRGKVDKREGKVDTDSVFSSSTGNKNNFIGGITGKWPSAIAWYPSS